MAKTQVGHVKFEADTKEFNESIKRANTTMRTLTSELKLTSAEMRATGQSAELLQNKQNTLTQMIDQARIKQEALSQKLEAARAVYDGNSEVVQKLERQLNAAKTQQVNLQNQLNQTNTAIERQEDAFSNLSNEIDDQETELKQLKDKYSSVVLEQGKTSDKAQDLAREIKELNSKLQVNKAKLSESEHAADELTDAFGENGKQADELDGKYSVVAGTLANLAASGIMFATQQIKELSGAVIDLGLNFTAAMSEVAALSGATDEELEMLEATAREMGATTQYSATDAATALKYMSLAGWDAEQMCGGISGVLSLAASSGMDLGNACDIVTDYLSAFGMEASQSAELADMMAFAQANANLTTENLAQSWKNCAAYLNAGGQDANTVTTALAMMANQGYKGAEAGTALTAIMRDMTAKMQDGAIMIGDTSIAVADAEGNYRNMLDIVTDIEAATADLSETERATALATTFTADSTKGLNLLLNAGADEAQAFSDRLEDSEGAAAAMADTMNDNLQGDLRTMNSALEEVGISVFEELEEPLRDAAQTFTRDVPKIGNSLKSVLPSAIRVATNGIRNLVSNFDQVAQSVAIMAGGLVASKVAFQGLKIAQSVSTWMTTLRAALAAGNTVINATKIATLGLNAAMAANPIGLVITGITTLIGVLPLYNAATDSTQAELNDLSAEFDEVNQRVEDACSSYEQFKDSQEKADAASFAETSTLRTLNDQLASLVDENGYVDEANRDRAQYIIDELSQALGIEIQMTDGVIENYQDLQTEIYKTIEAKEAEIMLQSAEEGYKNAIENKNDAEQNYLDQKKSRDSAYADLSKKQQERADLEADKERELAKLKDDHSRGSRERYQQEENEHNARIRAKDEEIAKAQDYFNEQDTLYNDSLALVTGYYSDIAQYESMSVAMQEGDIEKVKQLYNDRSSAIEIALQNENLSRDEQRALLETKLSDEKELLALYQSEMAKGSAGFTQEMVDDMQTKCDTTQQKLDEFTSTSMTNYTASLDNAKGPVKQSATNIYDATTSPFTTLSTDMTTLGSGAGYSFGSGVGTWENQSNAKTNANTLASAAESGLDDTNSYAKGEDFGKGYASGILSNMVVTQVQQKARSIAQTALDSVKSTQQSNSPAKKTIALGKDFGEGYAIGQGLTARIVENSAGGLANASLRGLADVEPPSFNTANYFSPTREIYLDQYEDQSLEALERICRRLDNLEQKLPGFIADNAPAFPDYRDFARLTKKAVNS